VSSDVVEEAAGAVSGGATTATKTAPTQLDSAARQQPKKQPRSKRK
jgi:hypothetical protein